MLPCLSGLWELEVDDKAVNWERSRVRVRKTSCDLTWAGSTSTSFLVMSSGQDTGDWGWHLGGAGRAGLELGIGSHPHQEDVSAVGIA